MSILGILYGVRKEINDDLLDSVRISEDLLLQSLTAKKSKLNTLLLGFKL
jgi:hypothetical protein